MRDRLIEILEDDYDFSDFTGQVDYEALADHLLKNGVVVPPCKVGDDIYYIDKSYLGIFSIRKTEFSYFWLDYEFFVTKEEAEAKLAELKGE